MSYIICVVYICIDSEFDPDVYSVILDVFTRYLRPKLIFQILKNNLKISSQIGELIFFVCFNLRASIGQIKKKYLSKLTKKLEVI